MNDDDLLAVLRSVLANEETTVDEDIPADVVARGDAAWSWRTVDEELAELLYDSADEPALAGLRGGDPPHRQLTFERGGHRLELEIGPEEILGQLLPPQPVEIRLQGPDRPDQELLGDDQGRFVLRPAPTGPVRLHCRLAGEAFLATGWIIA